MTLDNHNAVHLCLTEMPLGTRYFGFYCTNSTLSVYLVVIAKLKTAESLPQIDETKK